ncbi:ABC transporter ATP-binding protein [Nitrospira sp. Kam-Ns4a]
MAELELRGIRKSFGGVAALEDVSLRVEDGEFAVLLGPSGCGKSTLLRIVAGLEPQTAGQVLIGGAPVDDRSPGDRDIAMVFQHYALYPHYTVRENLAFGLRMRGEPRAVIEARIAEAAELLDIVPLLDRRPGELSGGQRQRVAIGRAIVRKPKLFLFDEPLSNLDARLRAATRVELKRLHRRLGATILYVTHDQVEAMTLGDRIIVMERGRIRQADTPQRIYDEPADPFVAAFIGSPGMNLLDGVLERQGDTWLFRAGALTLELPDPRELPARPTCPATLGIRPEDIRLEPAGRPELCVKADPDVMEDLGADRLLHVVVGDRRLAVRLARGVSVAPGAPRTLYLPLDRLHLFLADRRMPWA